MIDFLFLDKNTCYLCKENPISHHFLCKKCLKKLDYVANKFDIDDISAHAIYYYNEEMKKLVADYKFNRNTSLAKVFASMIFDYGKVNDLFSCDYILPSPSSKKVLNKRGFDHIKMITDYFIDQIEPNYLENFRKISETKAQHKLNKEERSYNLKGAFSIDCDLKDKSILIIDDIITTGNTVKEIGKVLKEKNAREVKALAITSEHRLS